MTNPDPFRQDDPITPPENNRNPQNLVDYIKTHLRETITYVLLIVGIIVLFFDPIYGGIIVGVIAGIYLGDEIVKYLSEWNAHLQSKGVAYQLILAGIAFAFFVSAPAIFLGAALAIGIKHLFVAST